MDEVHELEDALLVSVDTNASPTKSKQRGSELGSEDDDSSGLSDLDENSDSNESDRSDDNTNRTKNVTKPQAGGKDETGSESEDEPPEIPGSPLRVSLS